VGFNAACVCTSKIFEILSSTPLGVYSTDASLAVMPVFCYSNAIAMLDGDILKFQTKGDACPSVVPIQTACAFRTFGLFIFRLKDVGNLQVMVAACPAFCS